MDVNPSMAGFDGTFFNMPNADDEFEYQFAGTSDNPSSIYPPILDPMLSDSQHDELMNMTFGPQIAYDANYLGESSTGNFGPDMVDTGVGHVQGQRPSVIIPPSMDPRTFGPGQVQHSPYSNDILNSFGSPTTPLKVIDRVNFPFERSLQAELEKALQQKKVRGAEQSLATALLDDMASSAASPSPSIKGRPIARVKKMAGNKRPHNIATLNPKRIYEPLHARPGSWGPISVETNDVTFQYTMDGELNPLHSFTTDQIIHYISQHPELHNLTLWVQTVPADSGNRYPSPGSDKCRFAHCPDPKRTIRKGEFRVAFDEKPHGHSHDPFHNAGYVHLYCLEKAIDFPDLCRAYPNLVRPDTRYFAEGKNRMAITRDHESMEGIVTDFMTTSQPWRNYVPGRPADWYKLSLCSQLTEEHLDKQPTHLQKIRDQRQGVSIDRHRNNLDMRKTLMDQKKVEQAQKEPKPRAPKRKASTIDEFSEESVLDDNILELRPSPPKRRGPLRKGNVGPTATASRPNPGRWQRSPNFRTTKIRRTKSITSVEGPKRRGTRPAAITTRKTRNGSASSASSSSPKRRGRSGIVHTLLRRSPRSPKSPGGWTGFNLPVLPS